MQAITRARLVLHTATFAMWVVAAAAVGYWALKVSASSAAKLPQSTSAAANLVSTASDPALLARVLGRAAPPTTAPVNTSSRFVLKGVVSGALGQEAALIAIDDKPAKAFRVGSAIEDGLILQSASKSKVTLSGTRDGPALVTLDMPGLGK